MKLDTTLSLKINIAAYPTSSYSSDVNSETINQNVWKFSTDGIVCTWHLLRDLVFNLFRCVIQDKFDPSCHVVCALHTVSFSYSVSALHRDSLTLFVKEEAFDKPLDCAERTNKSHRFDSCIPTFGDSRRCPKMFYQCYYCFCTLSQVIALTRSFFGLLICPVSTQSVLLLKSVSMAISSWPAPTE